MEYLQLIFTSDFVNSIIRMSTPVLFVAMAACISRQANVLCLSRTYTKDRRRACCVY